MKFLRAIVGKTRRERIRNHKLGQSSRWWKYRTKSRKVNWDGLDMLKEWMSIEYQKEMNE
jgi:hypothetical protein